MENHKITEVATDFLNTRIKEYELYCATKQIICIIPSQFERDALFKYLLDGNIWDDPQLTEERLIEEINDYFIAKTLLS